jgi:hypothetical protein
MKNTIHPTAAQLAVAGQPFTDSLIQVDNTQPSVAGESAPSESTGKTKTVKTSVEMISVPQKSTRTIWINKLLFTLISLKFWGLIASMAVTTHLLIHRYQGIAALVEKGIDPQMLENISIGITGAQWITFNVTIWTMLYGIKEVRKVANQTKKSETGTTA